MSREPFQSTVSSRRSMSKSIRQMSPRFRFGVFAAVLLLIITSLTAQIFLARRVQAVSTTVVISEFRVRGPNGGSDEFIELYNVTNGPINIGGWKINGSSSTGVTSTRLTITLGTTIATHG